MSFIGEDSQSLSDSSSIVSSFISRGSVSVEQVVVTMNRIYSHQETYIYLLAPCTRLYKVKNVKSSQGKIVGLHWSKGRSRFCPRLSHNHKVKTLGLRN